MDVLIQKCQNCGSRALRNILSREAAQNVYVQCRDCGELVARYVLSTNQGYFHAGRGFESFLRSMERGGGYVSGRDLQEKFDELSTNAQTEFESVVDQAKERYKGELP